MSDNTIPRHIEDREQWSPDDFFHFAKTGELPANPAWIERRNEVLAEAGLEPEQAEPVAIEDMSPAEHEARRRGE